MVIILSYFLISLALVWVIIATITDLKKREVPDWLSFSLIAIALFSRLLFSFIEKDYSFFLWGVIWFVAFFILANLFYYTKIFAGGDAKLMMGLGAIFAEPPQISGLDESGFFPFPITFILNLFLMGAVYGLIFTLSIAIKHRKSFVKKFKERMKNQKNKISIYLFIIAVIVTIFIGIFQNQSYFFFLAMGIGILGLLIQIVKVTEEVGMIATVSADKLTEGDWLVSSIKVGNKIIKPKWEGLSKKEIFMLQKLKKRVIVKYGIPFVPAFLLALLVSILFGNMFEILLRLFF